MNQASTGAAGFTCSVILVLVLCTCTTCTGRISPSLGCLHGFSGPKRPAPQRTGCCVFGVFGVGPIVLDIFLEIEL